MKINENVQVLKLKFQEIKYSVYIKYVRIRFSNKQKSFFCNLCEISWNISLRKLAFLSNFEVSELREWEWWVLTNG